MPLTSSSVRAPVTVEQGRVSEDAQDRGVRGLGEFVYDRRIGVGQA